MRRLLACVALAAICAVVVAAEWNKVGSAPRPTPVRAGETRTEKGARDTAASATWGNGASLADHFSRHGRDFGAKNPDDYARMAADFLQRARKEALPAKVDDAGVLRVFDPASGAFGAYNRDGTTKTFFKPNNPGYFDRQPGRSVNLNTWR